MSFGAHSEVGRLRKVMVHRPGLEHSRLTPSNAEELLFDGVLWVARAKAEHDMFCEAMRKRGVEVFEAEELLAQALANPEARDWVSGHILNEREVGITAARNPETLIMETIYRFSPMFAAEKFPVWLGGSEEDASLAAPERASPSPTIPPRPSPASISSTPTCGSRWANPRTSGPNASVSWRRIR
jgi:arginine deiminase